jgi:DNA processing protein
LDIIEPLLSRFDSVDQFWSAPRKAITVAASPAVNHLLQELWRQGQASDEWRQAMCWQVEMERQNIHLLLLQDANYPELLRDIPDRPAALYTQGDIECLSLPQIAIVGSRNAGRSGLELAASFSRELAAAGFAISSGLALGIDGAAHQGALESSGRTIAVLGAGVDRIYPRRHTALARQIVARGLLVSEFPLGSGPTKWNFPRRNRILAGCSLGTLVVEAAAKSGSLITARLAMDYNREVFAVPGSIHNPNAKGSHQLIRDGAKLVETTTHIVEELGGLLQLLAAEAAAPATDAENLADLPAHLRALLGCIEYHPTSFDRIAERSGSATAQLSGELLELELAGWLESIGAAWQRIR